MTYGHVRGNHSGVIWVTPSNPVCVTVTITGNTNTGGLNRMTLPTVHQLVTSLPGVVVTKLDHSLRLDTTNADSEQWAYAVAYAEGCIPAEAVAEVFRENGNEVWVYSW